MLLFEHYAIDEIKNIGFHIKYNEKVIIINTGLLLFVRHCSHMSYFVRHFNFINSFNPIRTL